MPRMWRPYTRLQDQDSGSTGLAEKDLHEMQFQVHYNGGRNTNKPNPVKERTSMKIVIIESPWSGGTPFHASYLRSCIKDSIMRGEVPIASHKLYGDVLNDHDPAQRKIGIELGYEFWPFATRIIFYLDHGMSPGMKQAKARAEKLKIPTEDRKLADD